MFLLSTFSSTVFSSEYEYMKLANDSYHIEKATSQFKMTCFPY